MSKEWKEFWYAVCFALFTIGAAMVVFVYAADAAEQPKKLTEPAAAPITKQAVNTSKVFQVRELQGTDSDCEDVEKLSKGKFNQLLPRYVPGPFGPNVENKVITISREFLTGGLRAPALQDQGQDTMDRASMWRVRPFGANLEDSMGYNQKGEAVFFRPFFSVLTKTGSVITGRSIYGLNPAEIDLIVRVTPGVKAGTRSGHRIAWIKLTD
jgi:hypothetical protein